MSKLRLDKDLVEAAVLGGAVLGGGGGGSVDDGRRNGLLAVQMGQIDLVDLDDLSDDATIATASAVGAPAAKTAFALPVHYVKAVEILSAYGGISFQGLNTSENGGISSTNGWIQAATLGLPVVDAPCNGRAHPIAVMGSMGLHKVEGYVSMQGVAGGDPAAGSHLESFIRGNLEKASAMVRYAAVQAGGMVAVARNPVTVAYAKEHAAAGALKQAISIGRAMVEKRAAGAEATIEAACQLLHSEVVGRGQVIDLALETRGGLDIGTVLVSTGPGTTLELTFWNEYMTLESLGSDGKATRLATFPDLMVTFDSNSGLPLSSAMIQKGQDVTVVRAPREQLILGAGMRYPELIKTAGEAVGKVMMVPDAV